MNATRIPILYVTAVVDGDANQATIDWFANLDRTAWDASVLTTQPSPNRRLLEVSPFATEVWDLPDVMPGQRFPEFILGFIESREVEVLHILDARLGFDLLPDVVCLPQPPIVVGQFEYPRAGRGGDVRYVTRRYGNLVDGFSVSGEGLRELAVENDMPASRVTVIPPGAGSAGRHAELYRRLIAARPPRSRWRNEELLGESIEQEELGPPPAPIPLPRTPPPERSVGLIVPCYRHGIFLPSCIESLKGQTMKPARIVVVDDGSDDPETIAALADLGDDPEVEVIRQEVNRGPSAARNRALEALDTSYVLPIDADDQLLPDALEQMVARLESAPENVGFIYPHAQHFGNRHDFVRMPAYNLWLLMNENFCPAPALFDRRLFAPGGVSYPEDIVVGHEDWDLILQLCERGVEGLHADGPTFLYRRQGFSRVNAVDYGPRQFQRVIERRHPHLYRREDEIKADWAPTFSAVLLDDGGSWSGADLERLGEQSLGDFEVLSRRPLADRVRVVGEDAATTAEWLQEAVKVARGRWVCILAPRSAGVWSDRSFIEHMVHGFIDNGGSQAVALGRVEDLARPALARLDDEERQHAEPVGLAFERRAAVHLPDVELSGERPFLADAVLRMQARGALRWRLVRGDGAATPPGGIGDGAPLRLSLNLDRRGDRSEFATRDLIAHQAPRLPELTTETPRRWKDALGWTAPGTYHLCRHVAADGGHRMIANHRDSPPGYTLEFDLGTLYVDAFPGARRLVHVNHSFELIDDQNMLGEDRHGLGYVEQDPLPELDELELRRMPRTGQMILVAGSEDPLFDVAEPVASMGWIAPFPLYPRPQLIDTAPWGAIPLRRRLDADGFRHVYGTAADADGETLGSLFPGVANEELVALRLRADGRLASELAQPGRASRDPRRLLRWVAGSDPADLAAAQSPRRRVGHLAADFRGRRLLEEGGTVLGALRRTGGPDLYPLFSTTHPATGDQLATCEPRSAIERGYLLDEVLGFVHIGGRDPELR